MSFDTQERTLRTLERTKSFNKVHPLLTSLISLATGSGSVL